MKETLNLEMSVPAAGQPEELQEQIYQAAEKVLRAREEEFGEEFRRFRQVPLPRDHRPAVEGPPAGDGPPAPGHRPARLRPEGPEAGVQEGGLRRASSRCWRPSTTSSISQLMRVQGRAQAEEAARLQRQMAGQGAAVRRGPCRRGRASGEGRRRRPRARRRRRRPKVGRNDPCPCGSGKKYKKCHGASEDRPN